MFNNNSISFLKKASELHPYSKNSDPQQFEDHDVNVNVNVHRYY